ncbi:MAG: PhzF family phenazine biosynthesis protein [Alphaproteobacteria bacterium]|nr:PhzF family phenazine biosynthesis protein [Alphaproteobacteria bacterium]
MRKREFVTLDVFTTERFAGNPLAVVLDGTGIADAAMQSIAREFNLSETVFVLPARGSDERAFIRIFTPARELPFAGHPTVGTAVALALTDRAGAPGKLDFVLGEKVGPVPCAITVTGTGSGSATFSLPKLPERVGDLGDRTTLAPVLGLEPGDIGFGAHAAAIFAAGGPFPLVPVAGRAAVDRVVLSGTKPSGTPANPASNQVFVYCAEPVDSAYHYYARMLAPGFGIAEDPATGLATACFAGAIMEFQKPGDGTHRFVIEQGYAMGRPSQIELTLHVERGKLVRATIGGGAVVVTTGTFMM